ALALIIVAAFMVIYPISRPHMDQLIMAGDVRTNGKPVTLLVVALPHSQQTVDSSGHVTFTLPAIKDVTYRVKYEVDQKIVFDQEPKASKDGLTLATYEWNASAPSGPGVSAQKD